MTVQEVMKKLGDLAHERGPQILEKDCYIWSDAHGIWLPVKDVMCREDGIEFETGGPW